MGACIHIPGPDERAIGSSWSRACKVWIWARLLDGNRADKIFSEMIGEAVNENLTSHSTSKGNPLQLDGSMTTPGFIAEMLLQSQWKELHLLPALPDKWPAGSVTGLVARGGHQVDLKWDRG